jgi:phosphotransferase system HPr (HPr) family protein
MLSRASGGATGRSRCNQSGMTEPRAAQTVVINNSQGLHARPADLFAKLAQRFESQVEVVKGNQRIDGKAILSLLTLAAAEGTELTIEARGPDAQAAVAALAELVERGFGEREETVE